MDITPAEIERLVGAADGDAFVLEIGAMDGIAYDTLHHYITTYRLRGLLVEPLPDMFDLLVSNYQGYSNLLLENVAITEQDEMRDIYRVDRGAIGAGDVPPFSDGLSSFFLDRNSLGADVFKPYVRKERVRCTTLAALLTKHGVDRIDLLQIDTEGYDYAILKQVDFEEYSPYIVKIEAWSELEEDRMGIIRVLHRHGYTCRLTGDDIIGTKGLD